MNIFYLNELQNICATYHVNRHVVSQIKETAQILSTTHRFLDGSLYIDSSSGRKIKRYKLENNTMDENLYKATHVNHPSVVWCRESSENYKWLFCLFTELLKEYTHRYNKEHACTKMLPFLVNVPKNIPNKPFTEPTPAMPDEYIVLGDSIQSYRNYYNNGKRHLFNWTNRDIPEWIKNEN